MRVTCDKCQRAYDDEHRWTICPHNVLESGPSTPHYNCGNPGYCAGHDLFNCTMENTSEEQHAHHERSA